MALVCSGHRYGWPVARGGSGAIAAALAAAIEERGGRIETGRPVRSLDELPAADAVVLDLAPGAVAQLAGGRLPARVARAYRRYRHGPAAFKLDLAVEGGSPGARRRRGGRGTVHVAGSFEELVEAERQINRGRMPARPFVLVGQQYLADPAARRATSTRSGPTPTSRPATRATPARRSSTRSSASPREPASRPSPAPPAARPSWPRPTPTSSAATSPPAPTSGCGR